MIYYYGYILNFDIFEYDDKNNIYWDHVIDGATRKAIETNNNMLTDNNVVIIGSTVMAIGGLIRNNKNSNIF